MVRNALYQQAAVALVLVAAPLVACDRSLPGTRIEDSIHADLKAKGSDLASIQCPSKFVPEKGAKTYCLATDADGNTATFTVTLTDAKGGTDWAIDAQIIELRSFGENLEPTLTQQLGKKVDVLCPAHGIIARQGRPFTCDLEAEGATGRVECTPKDDDGHATCEVSGS